MVSGAPRAGALAACALGALALLLGDEAQAQQNSSRTVAQVERDRRAADARAAELRRQADAARRELTALDIRLVQSGARRAETEIAAAAAEQRLVDLRMQMHDDGARYRRNRTAFEAALIAAAFSERRIEPRAVRTGIAARALGPELNRSMRRSATALAAAATQSETVMLEQSVLADAQAAIDSERAEILTLAERRRAQQDALARDASAAERRARQFAAEARTLRELTPRLAAARPRGSSAGNSNGAAVVLPSAWLAPADGQVTRNYGSRVAGGPPQQGIALRTAPSAAIIAPASGEIAYAGLFRSYGQVLILNLEGGYALVLTGLDTLQARTGETVRAGQPIGAMSAAAMPAPELYVEVRRNGQPVDPSRWLSARGLTTASASGRNG